MYVAYRPTLDVQTTSNFDVGTTGVDRLCIDVVYMLSNVATLFQSIFDVETTSVCLLEYAKKDKYVSGLKTES